jgi:hypothetical protein
MVNQSLSGKTDKASFLSATALMGNLEILEQLKVGEPIATQNGRLRGTHQGPFPLSQGITPTGEQVTISVLDAVRLEGKKLVESKVKIRPRGSSRLEVRNLGLIARNASGRDELLLVR